jgi:hypothetical protein
MKRHDLANEIRGVGHGLRYADGPVFGIRHIDGKRMATNSPQNKLATSDLTIIRMAATCFECLAEAPMFDIEFAEEVADCYQSFARLIWPCIDHEEGCGAVPHISVSEHAQSHFAKVKAEFDRRRAEHAQQLASPAGKATPKKRAKKVTARPKARSDRRSTTKAKPTIKKKLPSKKKSVGKRRLAAKKKSAKKKR